MRLWTTIGCDTHTAPLQEISLYYVAGIRTHVLVSATHDSTYSDNNALFLSTSQRCYCLLSLRSFLQCYCLVVEVAAVVVVVCLVVC